MAVDIYFDDGMRAYGPDHPELQGIHIVGTEGNDVVTVKEKNGVITVTAARPTGTGLTYSFASQDVRHIFFHGFGGNDTYTSNSSAETWVWGGDGRDTIQGGWGHVHLFGEGQADTISAGNLAYGEFWGGSGRDTIYGTQLGNEIHGGDDVDTIYGRGGDDHLLGEDGVDYLYGEEGDDTLDGGRDHDHLYGGENDDILIGGEGNDFLFGGTGYDRLSGDQGNDYLDGGDDLIRDLLVGSYGGDTFKAQISYQDGQVLYFSDYVDFVSDEGDRYDYSAYTNLIVDVPQTSLMHQWLVGGASGFAADPSSNDAAKADELFALSQRFEYDPAAELNQGLVESMFEEPAFSWTTLSAEPMPSSDTALEVDSFFAELAAEEAAADPILDPSTIETSPAVTHFTYTAPVSQTIARTTRRYSMF